MRQIRFTKEGYEKLKNDYEDLLAQRPAAVEDLKKARELGDLSENGYYRAARSKLSSIDGRLRRMAFTLKQAVIAEHGNKNTVGIGNKVTLSDGGKEVTYEIVGDLEANPSEGKISLLSPIGHAIVGRKTGDKVVITTPASQIGYKITNIS